MTQKLTISFNTVDVVDLLGMTEEQAEEFISNNRNQFQGRMCELGHQVIQDLHAFDTQE